MKLIPITYLLFFSLFAHLSQAAETTVAVASNFSAPMKEIVEFFERSSGHTVRLSFGASGKFYAQIKHGAPFDLFFSADQSKPAQLERDELIAPSSRFTYAIGGLALWSANTQLINNSTTLHTLQFNKLALATPKLAPYGFAATEVLAHLGLTEKTKARWVQGENIAQTYQFIRTGNADIGFVALSQITKNGKLTSGSSWIIPNQLYSPIKQDAVLLQHGQNNPAALALLAFIKSQPAQSIITSYGYQSVSAAP